MDDMISTGGTIKESVKALLEAGAGPEIVATATHGLLVEGTRDKLDREEIPEIFDTVAVKEIDRPQLRVVSVAPLIAVIRRFMVDESPGFTN